jgi:hypothetical protein
VVRSILAVVAGYLVFAVSSALLFGVSGVDPHAAPSATFVVGSIVYGMVFAALAGLVTASLAPRQRFLHAGILASIIWAIALVSLILQFRSGSVWSELATIFLISPAAAAAGFVRDRGITWPFHV